jgi:malate dehydrogenase (oxaloacetate-decarboxylating)
MDRKDIDKKALELHSLYRGKIQTAPKVPVRGAADFAFWYTPGVAAPCLAIRDDAEKVYEYTNRENLIAIVTDGTRVLGLGDIGPEASLPVMEGKALIFKYLGGVDAVPLALRTRSDAEFLDVVRALEPNFGGINLEDISQPRCFGILDNLRDSMSIPVWHDDQQGTALVVLAGLINAFKVVGKDLRAGKFVLLGAGAANVNIARLLMESGVPAGRLTLIDSHGIITRTNRLADRETYPQKYGLSLITNEENADGDLVNAFRGADAVIALSTPKPGTILPGYIRAMSRSPIVFACANPLPEIWPEDARSAGAAVVATGRSDFPNQANNSLGFPGLFRGVLDVRASRITDTMCLSVSQAIAEYAEKQGLSEEHILPSMDDFDLFEHEAMAVARQAVKEGLNRLSLDERSLRSKIVRHLSESRDLFNRMGDG